jgi:hypothetical protein
MFAQNEVATMADLSSTIRLLVTLALVGALRMTMPGGSAVAAEISPTSNDTIPAGTVITGANWQRYSRFMPAGMQAIFAGDHFWRIPPDVQIEIGDSIPIALPQRYLEDTARHAKQVTLTRVPEGGYVPAGYVAGIPSRSRTRIRSLRPTRSSTTPTTTTRRVCSEIFPATTLPIHTETSLRP